MEEFRTHFSFTELLARLILNQPWHSVLPQRPRFMQGVEYKLRHGDIVGNIGKGLLCIDLHRVGHGARILNLLVRGTAKECESLRESTYLDNH